MFMAFWDVQVNLPLPVALSALALIGYMASLQRRQLTPHVKHQARRELKRAKLIAHEIETTSQKLKQLLEVEQKQVADFKQRVAELLQHAEQQSSWQELCRAADQLLKPTQKMVAQVSSCYDELRQQCAQLLTFTELRTDPLTGICNRRALDESITDKIAMFNRYDSGFTIVIIDIDHFKKVNDEQGHLYGDEILTCVAKLLDQNVRDTDQVTRYGGEEFVIIMPHTPLAGAAIFANRLRERVAALIPVTISCGVATATSGDTQQSLLGRADSALYAAKKAGRNQVFMHNGEAIVSYLEEEADLTPAELNVLARSESKRRNNSDKSTLKALPDHSTKGAETLQNTEHYQMTEAEVALSRLLTE
jgi:diguanylate cyclase (GGDEF)-like protein